MAKNPWELPDGFDDSVKEAVKALFKSFQNAGKMIPKEALEALKFGNLEEFFSAMNWTGIEASFEDFKDIIAATAKKAGISIFEKGGVGSRLTFDLIDERSVYFAQWQGAELVRSITEDIRNNIRDVIARSTAGDMTWQEAAESINRFIPLTPRDAGAVTKHQERQYDRFIKKGVKPATAAKKAKVLADNYAKKLAEARAKTIARTEIANAAMEGQYLGWESGVQTGLIDNSSQKEWIAEPNACEICLPLDGKLIPWDAEFGSLGKLMPPAHPNCRCSAAMLPPDYAESPFTNQAFQKGVQNQFEVEFAKHLAGRHDQSTHAGGKATHMHPEVDSKPTKRVYKNSDWSELPNLPQDNPELTKIAGNYIGSSGNINEVLRTGKLMNYYVTPPVPVSSDIVEKIREQAKILEAGVRGVEVPEDILVQRGVSWETFGVEHEWGTPSDEADAKSLIGTTFADKGFVSCSTMSAYGKPIPMTQFQKRAVQLRISVPKGTKGVALNAWEREFLLPPNTAILITDVKVNAGGTSIVEAVVVKQ